MVNSKIDSARPKPSREAYELLCALSLGVAGAAVMGMSTYGPVKWVAKVTTGSILLASGAGIGFSRQWNSGDWAGAYQAFADGFGAATGPRAKQVATAVATRSPAPIRTVIEAVMSTSSQNLEARLLKLAQKSTFIGGASNSGKTVFMLLFMEAILRYRPDSYIQICDTDYGKRGNTWSKAPLGIIAATTFEEIHAVMMAADEEMDRRQAAMRNGESIELFPYYVFFDELNNTLKLAAEGRLPEKEARELLGVISRFLVQAHGYNMFLFVGVQSLAVGKTSISLADLAQVNVALIGDGALNGQEIKKICGPDQKAQDLISQVRTARKIPGSAYTCLFSLAGEGPSLQWLPEIDRENIQIQWPKAGADPVIDWVNGFDWGLLLQESSPSAAWDTLGEPRGEKRSSNRYWCEFRDRWRKGADDQVDAQAPAQLKAWKESQKESQTDGEQPPAQAA